VSAVSEKRGDVVYTPDWAAKDMVDHFQPSGVVLDPCRGKGAFADLLPGGSPWCEISDGVDFFAFTEHVDCIIGNPPYSLTRPWFRHSFTIADRAIYLVPIRNVTGAYGFWEEIYRFGGIQELRVYGTGGKLGFPMGNAIGAFDMVRGYSGPIGLSFYEHPASVVHQGSLIPAAVGVSDETSDHAFIAQPGCNICVCGLSEAVHGDG
jgi:hypothetical protein